MLNRNQDAQRAADELKKLKDAAGTSGSAADELK